MSKVLQDLKSNGYAVVDDVFSKKDYSLLKRYFNNCEWSFTSQTNEHIEGQITKEEALQDFGLVNIIHMQEQTKDSLIAKLFIDNVENYFEVDAVDRIKAGLFPPAESEVIHSPHIDRNVPHWTALYYFSTEKDAGHTYIYDQKYDPYNYKCSNEQWQKTKDNWKVQDKIEAKENRALIFRGDIYHSSSRPRTIFKRIAINVNFLGRPLSV